MQRRRTTPPDIQTHVLLESRRRCCLCVFLDHYTDRRKGQVAHLDHNPANADPDNLVFLCFEHHDEFDSRTSQGKNLTADEIKEYRHRLAQIVAKQDVSIAFPRTGEGISAGPTISSGRLLGRILDAFDRDLEAFEKGARPNGIALCHLATIAVTEQGDFRAAQEAITSLIRLAGKSGDRSSLSHPVTTADLVSATEQTLRMFAKTDFGLTLGALYRVKELAILGDVKMVGLDVETHSIPGAFYPVVQVLCKIGRSIFDREQRWLAEPVSSVLAQLLISAGMFAALQGVALPAPPEILTFTGQGVRTIPDDADMRTEPFVWAASRVAMLASPTYELAMKQLKFGKELGEIRVDPEKAAAYGSAEKILRRFAAVLGHMTVHCRVTSPEEIQKCANVRDQLGKIAEHVVTAAKEFVMAERELLLRRTRNVTAQV